MQAPRPDFVRGMEFLQGVGSKTGAMPLSDNLMYVFHIRPEAPDAVFARMLEAYESDSRVVALDVSDEMLARARVHNPDLGNVEWVLGDGRSLAPVPDASVDACVSVVVLQHAPDPQVTLDYVRDLGRALRPGAWAALQVSDDPEVHRPRQGPGQRLLAAVGRAPRGQRHPAWLGSRADLDAIAATAREHGVAVERVWGRGSQYCQVLLRRER